MHQLSALDLSNKKWN